MNRKNAVLAAALAVSLPLAVSAQQVQSNDAVHAALMAQGYTDITNVQHEGNSWKVDATAAGNKFRLRVDPNTGYAYPDAQDSNMSQMDIVAAIAAAGYTNISGVRFYGGMWMANATSPTGNSVPIKVDPADGRVIDENE
jgi:hypothetical protein